MERGDLANREKDLVIDSFIQKDSATVKEIQMSERLSRSISRHTLNRKHSHESRLSQKL